jgi:short-subunit dehydrogenase
MRQFKHQTALVTGAAAGIGRGLCLALCRHGAWVYAADIQADKLEELEAAATGPGSITPVDLDVSNAGQFEETFAGILEEHETLDLVINNAGIVVGGDFRDTGLDEIERITEINYWGVMYGTKLAYDIMTEQRHGHIVNVASPAGVMPVPLSTAYSATKHAVVGLSHSLREEAALYGVKVSTVMPGMVKSELWEHAINAGDYDYKDEMEKTSLSQITAEQAAKEILKGIARNQRDIIFPRVNKAIVEAYRRMPELMTPVVTRPLLKSLKESLESD